MKQELTDQEIDAIPWANTGSFPMNIRALARSVERIVTERDAQVPNYSRDSIELVSDHQKACIELLQEGNHDAMIRARLALLRLFADKDAEIERLKAELITLKEENEALRFAIIPVAVRKDAERYREFRKGKALVVKCGSVTIFHGSNPDYERKYPEALDAALDGVIAQAVQSS